MLERIKQERLQPEVQINIAKSINIGLDNMGSSEFSQFDFFGFIDAINNYEWNNQFVFELLQEAIKKTLRLKYQYFDIYQPTQQEPNWIEESIRSNFTFGQRNSQANSSICETNSNSMFQSVFQSPVMIPQRMMVSSQQEPNQNSEETKSKNKNFFTPKSESCIFMQVQSQGESMIWSSQNSMKSREYLIKMSFKLKQL
ncbi:hypothetical protein pb186bvf_011264 [Paramecium bursaria]